LPEQLTALIILNLLYDDIIIGNRVESICTTVIRGIYTWSGRPSASDGGIAGPSVLSDGPPQMTKIAIDKKL
jgi:hypothetical protein